jgi:glutamate racemase
LLATPGTVQSGSYPLEIAKLYNDITVTSEACPLWVPLIENNEHRNEGADFFVRKNIENLLKNDPEIDTVMLGCTHYPLIQDRIAAFLPEGIKVISQGELVASSLADYLLRHPEIETKCSKNGQVIYLTTESVEKFSASASVFLKNKVEAQHIDIG